MWFYDVSASGRQRAICVQNFDHISESTAEILLLSVAENKRPPYLNSTPGFDELFAAIGMWYCTDLLNFVRNRRSTTELWRHINLTSQIYVRFLIWLPPTFRRVQGCYYTKFRPYISIHSRYITTSGFWEQTAAMINSTSISTLTFHCHRHVILQWSTEFYPNWMIADRVMMSYLFFRMAAIASHIRFLVSPCLTFRKM